MRKAIEQAKGHSSYKSFMESYPEVEHFFVHQAKQIVDVDVQWVERDYRTQDTVSELCKLFRKQKETPIVASEIYALLVNTVAHYKFLESMLFEESRSKISALCKSKYRNWARDGEIAAKQGSFVRNKTVILSCEELGRNCFANYIFTKYTREFPDEQALIALVSDHMDMSTYQLESEALRYIPFDIQEYEQQEEIKSLLSGEAWENSKLWHAFTMFCIWLLKSTDMKSLQAAMLEFEDGWELLLVEKEIRAEKYLQRELHEGFHNAYVDGMRRHLIEVAQCFLPHIEATLNELRSELMTDKTNESVCYFFQHVHEACISEDDENRKNALESMQSIYTTIYEEMLLDKLLGEGGNKEDNSGEV